MIFSRSTSVHPATDVIASKFSSTERQRGEVVLFGSLSSCSLPPTGGKKGWSVPTSMMHQCPLEKNRVGAGGFFFHSPFAKKHRNSPNMIRSQPGNESGCSTRSCLEVTRSTYGSSVRHDNPKRSELASSLLETIHVCPCAYSPSSLPS